MMLRKLVLLSCCLLPLLSISQEDSDSVLHLSLGERMIRYYPEFDLFYIQRDSIGAYRISSLVNYKHETIVEAKYRESFIIGKKCILVGNLAMNKSRHYKVKLLYRDTQSKALKSDSIIAIQAIGRVKNIFTFWGTKDGVNYALYDIDNGRITAFEYSNIYDQLIEKDNKKYFYRFYRDTLELYENIDNLTRILTDSEYSCYPHRLALNNGVLEFKTYKRTPLRDFDYAFPCFDHTRSDVINIAVNRNDKWGIYNRHGKEIIPCELDTLFQLQIKQVYVGTSTQSYWPIYGDEDFETYFIDGCEECTGRIRRKIGVMWSFKRDGKWGVVNKKGKTVVPFEYDMPVYIESYNETGYYSGTRLIFFTYKDGEGVYYEAGKGEVEPVVFE